MNLSKVNSSHKSVSQKKFMNYTKLIFGLLIYSTFISTFIHQFSLVDHSAKNISSTNNTKIYIPTSHSFSKQMQSFPWLEYKYAVDENDILAIQHYTEQLITSILIPFTTKESTVPVNSSCHPPPIQELEKIGPCVPLQLPRKVGVILNFGFDVDALELHLHELDAVIDKFFLMEGLKINNRYLDSKPSIWNMIKFTSRFSKFRHKIVHFIVDDADYSVTQTTESSLPELWDRENLQKNIRLQKFLKWNLASGYFGPQDILVFADTDEISNRNVVNFLKSCELQHESIRLGIWFPFPYIDTIFASDYPLDGYPFTYNGPVYSTLAGLINSLTKTTKNLGRSDEGSILGGIHFSKYPYLPFQCIKMLTATESELDGLTVIIDIGFLYKSNQHGSDEVLDDLITERWLYTWHGLADRIKSVNWFLETYGDYEADAIIKLPWFYQCNPERFPSFHRKRDKRLD